MPREADTYEPEEGPFAGGDPEGPSAEDIERFGDSYRTCPACKSEVWDQNPACHVCGHDFDGEAHKTPAWKMAVVVVVLLAFLLLLFGGIF